MIIDSLISIKIYDNYLVLTIKTNKQWRYLFFLFVFGFCLLSFYDGQPHPTY